jgi:hypothetical protein
MEWRTYTPDGRVLTVRRDDGAWAAACDDGREYRNERLSEAIRDAVGHERGESLLTQWGAHDALEAWVAEQAERIEREAG